MPPKGTPAQRERLTLAQLASYDDVITDALVDHVRGPFAGPLSPFARGLRMSHSDPFHLSQVYYWATIRKNRTKFIPSRGVRDEEVASILRESAIVGKDPTKAEEHLLKLVGIRKYLERLKTENERDDFRKHLRKYINIWLPDCPFEVSTTNRYTILVHEAAITARKVIPKGTTIKHLSGIQVTMTKDEEADLDISRRDFSIVMSSRKKSTSLFLGPARFANHDCDANARLVTSGPRGMSVAAVREIDVGEEITVSYGADYFGEENCECLCKTCETNGRNGWASAKSASRVMTPVDSDQTQEAPYSFRRKRRYESERSSMTPSLTPESLTPATTPTKKRKVGDQRIKTDHQSSQLSNEVSIRDQTTREAIGAATATEGIVVSEDTNSAKSDEVRRPRSAITTRSASRQMKTGKTTPPRESTSRKYQGGPGKRAPSIPQILLDGEREASSLKTETILDTVEKPTGSDPGDSSPSSSGIDGSRVSSASTDATSIFDESITIPMPRMQRRKTRSALARDTIVVTPVDIPVINNTVAGTSIKLPLTSESKLRDAPKSTTRPTASNKSKAKNSRRSPDEALPTTDPDTPIHSPKHRIPGDYRTSSALLFDCAAWVECTVCDESFIQPDAYFLRSACPRCERHSKIYGYQWPKTEKAGKGDKEERVLDHRTVHRFIKPLEERERRKERRLTREVSMGSSAIANGESEDARDYQQQQVVKRGRGGRGGWSIVTI
ncbi:MAG: Histone-lysine N-methyltransferase set9 [Trichoglossum hirsutum]|jgi:histone-lysine N-methyltransferase SUV420H|nr:MAG: Histone-lysine N-methyltransferase set9 [Trichoglossum hirsutum]